MTRIARAVALPGRLVAGALAAAAFGIPAASHAAEYRFAEVARNGNRFLAFGPPALNNSGTAAFVGFLNTDGGRDSGVYLGGAGGPLTTVADTAGPFADFSTLVSVNASGTVAFAARPRAGGSGGAGVFTGAGGPVATVADDSGRFADFSFVPPLLNVPAINDAGVVVFGASLRAGGHGIFSGGAAAPGTFADTAGPFADFGPGGVSFTVPSINNAGTAAFVARLGTGAAGVFTAPAAGGPFATVVDSTGPFDQFVSGVDINDAGTVAFNAYRDGSTGGGIYAAAAGGPVTTIADFTGDFGSFGAPAVNAAGDVAFLATLDAGGVGIFTGDDPVADKVIAAGDALFGSTVTDLRFSRALNDGGQIAFRYDLANGATGVAIATIVPEPAGVAVLLPVATTLRRRRR